jgi:hypothetical protein
MTTNIGTKKGSSALGGADIEKHPNMVNRFLERSVSPVQDGSLLEENVLELGDILL